MSDLLNEDQKARIKRAFEEGDIPVRAEPNELLLDLDDYDDRQLWRERLEKVQEYLSVEVVEVWKSSSLENEHAMLRAGRDLSVPEALLIETYLGSDRQRAILNLIRWWQGNPAPSLLIRPGQWKPRSEQTAKLKERAEVLRAEVELEREDWKEGGDADGDTDWWD